MCALPSPPTYGRSLPRYDKRAITIKIKINHHSKLLLLCWETPKIKTSRFSYRSSSPQTCQLLDESPHPRGDCVSEWVQKHVHVCSQVGDEVEQGQKLFALEAMKVSIRTTPLPPPPSSL